MLNPYKGRIVTPKVQAAIERAKRDPDRAERIHSVSVKGHDRMVGPWLPDDLRVARLVGQVEVACAIVHRGGLDPRSRAALTRARNLIDSTLNGGNGHGG